ISVSSSARDTWRILIAWRSCGVITSCCVSRCWRTMRASFAMLSQSIDEGVRSEAERFAEVDLPRARTVRDLRRRALLEHRSFVHDVRAIADAESFAHVVIRNEYPDPSSL